MTQRDIAGGFAHRFVPGTRIGAPVVLLLHGTGGNEDDLLELGAALAPGAPLLSPRGKVLENGMPRFFRRLAEGVFDLDDLRFRANELADFVRDATHAYGVDQTPPVAAGFSNGANIAAAMLLLRPETLSGALLLRPMVPLVPDPLPDLAGSARADRGRAHRSDHPSEAERSARRSAPPLGCSGGHRVAARRTRAHPGRSGDRLAMVRSFFSFAQTLTPAMVVSRRFAQPRVLGAAHPSPKPACARSAGLAS